MAVVSLDTKLQEEKEMRGRELGKCLSFSKAKEVAVCKSRDYSQLKTHH